MSTLKTSLLAALAAALLTGAALYYINQHRSREAVALRRSNNRLRLQAVQKLQPPAPVIAPAAPLAPTRLAPDASPPQPVPSYRNEGRGTPKAAVQTFAWACDRGDVASVSQMIFIDPPARQMAEAFLAGLPEKQRAQWKTVDEMAAELMTLNGRNHPFPKAGILDTAVIEAQGDARAVFRLPGTPRDGIQLQKTAEGWSYVITEAMVRAYVRNSAAR